MAKTEKKYKASVKFYEARKLSVPILILVVEKLRKLIEQDLLEHAPPGGSKWVSSFVVLRKSYRNMYICGDYRICVNHKICSDNYPIPNVGVAIHAPAGMNVFTKVDF